MPGRSPDRRPPRRARRLGVATRGVPAALLLIALVALGAVTAVFITPSASADKGGRGTAGAAFTWAPTAPATGQAVTFDGSVSTCSPAPCTYAWTDAVDGSSLGSGVKSSFTFQGAGTKQVTLKVTDATSRTDAVEHDVNVGSGTTTTPTPPPSGGGTGSKLTWAPPACGDASHGCVDLNLSDTGSNQSPSLSASNDYRIHLPKGPLRGGLQIRGGHNVIIIGGEIDLTVPCSDASSSCHGINIDKGTPGQIFIEGVWIHNPQSPITQSTGDGIDVADNDTAINDITLENLRIDGISGCSGGADHADVFQPFSAPDATIRIDHLTGTTNCQGAQVEPDLAWLTFGKVAKLYDMRNVNIDVLPNPFVGNGNRYAYWFGGGTNGGVQDGCGSGPVQLTNVWASEPSGTLSANSVWPDTNQPSSCVSSWSGTSGTLSFPHSPQISGQIRNGKPSGGDLVPVGLAGSNYVSPGY